MSTAIVKKVEMSKNIFLKYPHLKKLLVVFLLLTSDLTFPAGDRFGEASFVILLHTHNQGD